MPIYEYKCQSCGHELEKLQRISDPTLTDCPFCDEPSLQRLVSAAGFRLKGAGWYETDFKKGSKKNLHESGASKTTGSKPAESEKAPAKTAESSKTGDASAVKKTDAA
jgi:putative FmdB family regulatory protein